MINGANSRSKVAPLPSNTSRCPVAEVTQIRSLDGTTHNEILAEQIDPEEKNGDGEVSIESPKLVVAELRGQKNLTHCWIQTRPATSKTPGTSFGRHWVRILRQ